MSMCEGDARSLVAISISQFLRTNQRTLCEFSKSEM